MPTLLGMSTTLQVPTAVRLRLAHGCLEHHARTAGARILHIKGEALHPVLSAGRPGSTDCDVLVAPADVAAFTRVLEAAGWEQITTFPHGSVFGHAAAFHHQLWGTVDVHRWFPGMHRDPAHSFERLWSDHEVTDLGGIDCAVPALLHQRLLLLVHAARESAGKSARDVEAAWGALDDAGRQDIVALAHDLGAEVPLGLVTGQEGLVTGGPDEHLWRALDADADPTAVWRARLRDSRGVLGRGRVLAQAMHVNHDHLSLRLGHAPSRRELRREWWSRWGRLAKDLLRRR